jgi:hypothetical protein
MRALAIALLVFCCTAAVAEDASPPGVPPTNPANPTNAANPEGAPKPPPKWVMREDQRAHRGECLKLTRQIARYERDAEWAEDRDDEMWEVRSMERVYRLAAKREALCPSEKGPSMEDLLAKAAVMAARLAMLASSYGAF